MWRMSEKITAIVKKEHFSGLTSGVWLVKLHGSKNLKNIVLLLCGRSNISHTLKVILAGLRIK